ncbi:MAG TPA: glycoside hydrolase family 44 protein [Chloroflexia bacterium]|nr:glycoside hydrolase family 44 protein [Chloroflexia bacterium]
MQQYPLRPRSGVSGSQTRRLPAALCLGGLLLAGCTLLDSQPRAPLTAGPLRATTTAATLPNAATQAPVTPVPLRSTVVTAAASAPAPVIGSPAAGAGPAASPSTARPPTPLGSPAPAPAGQPVPRPVASVPPFVVYAAGQLASAWEDASYGGATADLRSTEVTRHGQPTVKVTYACGWCAWVVADWNHANSVDTGKYSHLHFWINGGPTGGQIIGITLGGARLHVDQYIPGHRVPAGQWQEVLLPLDDLAAGGPALGEITFQEVAGHAQAPYYVDGLEFYQDPAPQPTPILRQAEVTVDVSSGRRPISPLIYGMSLAPVDVIQDAHIPLNRLGGNPYSRYNWRLGSARNAGSDDNFRNYTREPDDPSYTQPSGLPDMWFKTNQGVGAEVLLTVPILGYVAKDTHSQSTGVPDEGGPPRAAGSPAITGYDPTQNRAATSVLSLPRKGGPFQDPPHPQAPAVYQDEWINHLTHAFGPAGAGGVRFYAMDNEPDLWADNTHVDVQPTRVGYDALLKLFLEYGTAVKAVDPAAAVTGPVVSGWTGYWYSALDRGSDSFHTAGDRSAHGGMPLLPWFLDQVHKHDQATGQRTLDVLDIHYYPQGPGVYSDKADPTTAALRLRSTRSLWDPAYVDESWIGRTDPPQVALIPRMQSWIDQYYPGTRLGITEWNWGAEGTMNGALAIADVLGIYGREGVYLATYFTNPPRDSPGLASFKLYRNFDGHGGTFGDVAIGAQSSDQEKLGVYASEDTQTQQIKIMVLNKTPREQIAAQITVRGGRVGARVNVFQLSAATQSTIQALPDAPINGLRLSYLFPPSSITLLVLDEGP